MTQNRKVKPYHVAYVWSWPSGRRFWQASTELDCISPDVVYYTVDQARNKKEAIEIARRKGNGRRTERSR